MRNFKSIVRSHSSLLLSLAAAFSVACSAQMDPSSQSSDNSLFAEENGCEGRLAEAVNIVRNGDSNIIALGEDGSVVCEDSWANVEAELQSLTLGSSIRESLPIQVENPAASGGIFAHVSGTKSGDPNPQPNRGQNTTASP